jgi:hypothetical protein
VSWPLRRDPTAEIKKIDVALCTRGFPFGFNNKEIGALYLAKKTRGFRQLFPPILTTHVLPSRKGYTSKYWLSGFS